MYTVFSCVPPLKSNTTSSDQPSHNKASVLRKRKRVLYAEPELSEDGEDDEQWPIVVDNVMGDRRSPF